LEGRSVVRSSTVTFLQDAGVEEDGLLDVDAGDGVDVRRVADARVEVRTGLQDSEVHATVVPLPRRTRVD